jgi:small subunit ribosomal protein S6
MREYEMTVVFDLALTEAEGPDASVELLTSLVESRGGSVLKVDHWGRRRLAYPIKAMIDAEYVVSRVELEGMQLREIEAALGINERVLRFLAVRADELPPPPPPREMRDEPAASPAGVASEAPADEAPAAQSAQAEAAPIAEAPAEAEAAPAEAEEAPAAAEPVVEATTETTAEPAADEAPAVEAVAEPEEAAAEGEDPAEKKSEA